ncbi:MAG TPA: DHA2 family efflux MFS transporter permease subunit, partial [Phenylobacterium sp.]
LSERAKVAIFVVMSVGQMIALLDIQIVAGALGPIRAGLSAGQDEIAWVQTAYLMAEIVMIPLAAFLAQALSTRWLFTASAALFTLSSLMCGLAWDLPTMIAFRAIQGFVGGAMIPTVFAMTYMLFEGPRRVAMAAVLGMLSTLAPTLGPTIGGWVNELAGWRWLFFMNLVPGLAIVLILPRLGAIDRARPHLLRRIDWLQAASIAVCLGGLQYVLEEGPRREWFADLGVATAGWLSLLGAAVFVERCLFSPMPVVRLGVFRRPSFALASGLNLACGFGMYASTYMTPLFLGGLRGFTTVQIGGVMLVTGVSMTIAAPIASRLAAKVDGRLVIAAGYGLFAGFMWAASAITPQWGFGQLFIPQVMRGFAVLFCIIPSTAMALDGVPPSQLHYASGLFNLMRTLGGALGIAAVTTWLGDLGRLHVLRLSEALGQAPGRAGDALAALASRASEQTSDPAHALALAQSYMAGVVQREAATQAFADVFRLLGWGFLGLLLLVPFCRPPRIDAPATAEPASPQDRAPGLG